ncbi:hypothetical protein L4D77_24040 [Photobacterium frigidiphilum]|nr:hypothetical protein [Photobacterium frigidiphilum]
MPELIESVMSCEVTTENEQDSVTLDGLAKGVLTNLNYSELVKQLGE